MSITYSLTRTLQEGITTNSLAVFLAGANCHDNSVGFNVDLLRKYYIQCLSVSWEFAAKCHDYPVPANHACCLITVANHVPRMAGAALRV